jgi:hypothetical protein
MADYFFTIRINTQAPLTQADIDSLTTVFGDRIQGYDNPGQPLTQPVQCLFSYEDGRSSGLVPTVRAVRVASPPPPPRVRKEQYTPLLLKADLRAVIDFVGERYRMTDAPVHAFALGLLDTFSDLVPYAVFRQKWSTGSWAFKSNKLIVTPASKYIQVLSERLGMLKRGKDWQRFN